MKGKFSLIWRVAIALVLVLSFSLVMAVPAAATVSQPTVVVDPSGVGQTAQYTIAFITTEDLAVSADDDIRIEFPEDTTVPGSYVAADITINDVDAGDKVESVVDQLIIIDVPEDVAHGTVTVIFKVAAGIENPLVEGPYTLWVSTSREVTPVESGTYEITGPMGPVDVYDADDFFKYSYDTITDALDHPGITTGWTVKVHADTAHGGNYDSSLETYPIDIDVLGVTVESIDGAASTTIDASDWTPTLTDRPAAVVLKADDVTFGGDGVGFTVIAADDAHPGVAPESYGVEIWLDVDRATVEDNIITGLDESPQVGIHIWPGEHGNTDITIKDNTLTTTFTTEADWAKTSAGIWCDNLSGDAVLIDGNKVTGFSVGMDFNSLNGTSDAKPAIISNNIVSDSAYNGIEVSGDYILITDNEVYGNGGNGIAVVPASPDGPHIKVCFNDIYGNGNGVKVYSGITVTYIAVNFNDIYENTNTLPEALAELLDPYSYENYGVLNADDTDPLNATRNFWGDLSGPSSDAKATTPSYALGSGDIVSYYVYYEPWLTYGYDDPVASVVDDLVQYYGGVYYVELGPGWNTLATPVPLDARADQLSEIYALGGWMQNFTVGDAAYTYDPVNGWRLIQVGVYDPALVPCSAIYIKLSGKNELEYWDYDVMPCLKSGDFYMPTLDLLEGWNLVSLNYDECMPAYPAFKSIETLPGYGGYSQVINPPMPNQPPWDGDVRVWTPTFLGETWLTYEGCPILSPGWGYWVYMTGDKTLAGFLMTPQYLTSEELAFIDCTNWYLPEEDYYDFPWWECHSEWYWLEPPWY